MSDVAEQALAVSNLKAQYCFAADLAASDPQTARAQFAEIFADDFVGDYGFDPLIGGQAITDFLCTAIAAGSEWVVHMLHSPNIVVTGNSATGDWTVFANMKRREGGQVDIILGRYSDTFRLTPQGWRIASVKFTRMI